MELKAVKEYEEPKYATKEENRKGMIRFILSGGKFSLSVAVMCLLLSQSNVAEGNSMFDYQIAGVEPREVSLYEALRDVVAMVARTGGVLLIPIIIRLIMNNKAIKKCTDEEEKVKLRKRRSKELFIEIGALAIIVVCTLSFFIWKYNNI